MAGTLLPDVLKSSRVGDQQMQSTRKNCRTSVVLRCDGDENYVLTALSLVPAWVDEVLVSAESPLQAELPADLVGKVVFVKAERGVGADPVGQALQRASGDILVVIDSGCGADPRVIGEMVRFLRDGYDFVKGSRFLHGVPNARLSVGHKVSNSVVRTWVSLFHGGQLSDPTSGVYGFWDHAAPKLRLSGSELGSPLDVSLQALRARLSIVEVPVDPVSPTSARSGGVVATLRDLARVVRARFAGSARLSPRLDDHGKASI